MSKRPKSKKALVPSAGQSLSKIRSHAEAQSSVQQKKLTSRTTKSRVKGKGYANAVIGSILSAKEIKAMSVCDLAAGPLERACLEDIRMGPREYKEQCGTCRCSYGVCTGHFSRIELRHFAWFAHPHYVKNGVIPAIMNLFCFECFKERMATVEIGEIPTAVMLFDEQSIRVLDHKYTGVVKLERLKALASMAKKFSCAGGGGEKAHACTYFKKTPDNTVVEFIDRNSPLEEVDGATMFYFLSSISNFLDDHRLHGFVGFTPMRWENFVIQVIPVIPTADRPAIIINGKKDESDFTALYWTLLNIVHDINASEGNEPKLVSLRKNLRDTYYAYVNSETDIKLTGRSKKTGDALKTLSMILDGKRGLYHKNIVSSRVDNSGRTVVAGDNTIKPNEGRVPMYMAEKFRIKLEVTIENRDIAQRLLKDGIVKTVARNSLGGRLEIQEIDDTNRDRFRLEVGDLCYRRLVTGDIIVINRQPTLHRWSVIALKAVVREHEEPGFEVNTIGMNTAYAPGLNMDFDGDEVHIHVPASIEARAEAAALMSVERAPISDQTSQNIFGVIQNSVWGAYKMTSEPENIEREDWIKMTENIQDFDAPIGSNEKDYSRLDRIKYIEEMTPRLYAKHGIKGLGIWNTRSLLSLAMPPDFSYTKNGIVIDRGILISGVFKKSIVGAGPGSITQHLFESKGPTATVIFVHVIQQVVSSWMETQGLTISIESFAPDDTLNDKVIALRGQHFRTVEELGQSNVYGIFNRDALIIELKRWIDIPESYRDVFSTDDVARLANEITFILFGFMQVERNLYEKLRSEYLFRKEKVVEALRRAINMAIQTPAEIIEKGPAPGKIFASSKMFLKPKEQVERESIKLNELKELIMTQITEKTISFIEEQMINPFDPRSLSSQSSIERATTEANIVDEMERMKNTALVLMKAHPGSESTALELVLAGARGNQDQLLNSKVFLGQQTMSNARLKESISGGTRVTPFFMKNDPKPEHRGAIKNSYRSRLTPVEAISAAMPARQTQTDTAFKTGETGYMQKLLMASCGDFIVYADGSVRDERGNIVSFLYGGMGFDPSRMVKSDEILGFVDVSQLVQQINAEEEAVQRTRSEYFRKL